MESSLPENPTAAEAAPSAPTSEEAAAPPTAETSSAPPAAAQVTAAAGGAGESGSEAAPEEPSDEADASPEEEEEEEEEEGSAARTGASDRDGDEEEDDTESDGEDGEDDEEDEEAEDESDVGDEEMDYYSPPDEETAATGEADRKGAAAAPFTVRIGGKSCSRSAFIPNQGLDSCERQLRGNSKSFFTLCDTRKAHNILTCKKLHLKNRAVVLDSCLYVRINMILDGAGLTALLANPAASREMRVCRVTDPSHDVATCDGVHLRPDVVLVGRPEIRVAYFEPELHDNLALKKLKKVEWEEQCGAWCRNRHSHDITSCRFLHYKRDGSVRERPRAPSFPLALVPEFNPYSLLPRSERGGQNARGKGGRGKDRRVTRVQLPEAFRKKRDKPAAPATAVEKKPKATDTKKSAPKTTPGKKTPSAAAAPITHGSGAANSKKLKAGGGPRPVPQAQSSATSLQPRGGRSVQDYVLLALVVAVLVVAFLLGKL